MPAMTSALISHARPVQPIARLLACRRQPFMMGGFGSRADAFPYTGTVRPGVQSPKKKIPSAITYPDYAIDGTPKNKGPMLPWQIEVKSAADIEGMRVAGRVAREVLDAAARMAKPGVTTDAIDALVTEETIKRGAYPSPLNYHGFPKSCCTSVNEVICHGIPDSSVLRDGDVLNIDITCYIGGCVPARPSPPLARAVTLLPCAPPSVAAPR